MKTSLEERMDRWVFYSKESLNYDIKGFLLHPDDKSEARILTQASFSYKGLPISFLGDRLLPR